MSTQAETAHVNITPAHLRALIPDNTAWMIEYQPRSYGCNIQRVFDSRAGAVQWLDKVGNGYTYVSWTPGIIFREHFYPINEKQ